MIFKKVCLRFGKSRIFAADLSIPAPIQGGKGLIVQGIERKFPKL